MGRKLVLTLFSFLIIILIGVSLLFFYNTNKNNTSLMSVNDNESKSSNLETENANNKDTIKNETTQPESNTDKNTNSTSVSNTENDADQQAQAAQAHQKLLEEAKAAAGSNLAEIKADLKALGYNVDPGDQFTDLTYNNVIKFQNEHGLDGDGKAGNVTYVKLEALVHPAPAQIHASTLAATQQNQSTSSTSSQQSVHTAVNGDPLYGEFGYADKGSSITITEYDGTNRYVQVPSQINGKPVTSIDMTFNCRGEIDTVVIPGTVSDIPTNTFAGCFAKEIILQNGVKSISYRAFGFNDNLTTVVIPNSVTSVSQQAFINCRALSSAALPNGISSDGVFINCPNIH